MCYERCETAIASNKNCHSFKTVDSSIEVPMLLDFQKVMEQSQQTLTDTQTDKVITVTLCFTCTGEG